MKRTTLNSITNNKQRQITNNRVKVFDIDLTSLSLSVRFTAVKLQLSVATISIGDILITVHCTSICEHIF